MDRTRITRRTSARVEALEPRRLMVGPYNGVSIVGLVYDDIDGDGRRDRNEPGVPGVQIDPAPTVTDAEGRFSVLDRGNNVSCQVIPPPGMHFTAGEDGYRSVEKGDLGPREYARVTVKPIALTRTARIAGRVFNDHNGDGVEDEYDDFGIRGQRVLLDLNGDGRRDRGERIVRTDRDGDFGFGGLDPGTYRVVILNRPRWTIFESRRAVAVAVPEGTVRRACGSACIGGTWRAE